MDERNERKERMYLFVTSHQQLEMVAGHGFLVWQISIALNS
jgi:hypothetical protein